MIFFTFVESRDRSELAQKTGLPEAQLEHIVRRVYFAPHADNPILLKEQRLMNGILKLAEEAGLFDLK